MTVQLRGSLREPEILAESKATGVNRDLQATNFLVQREPCWRQGLRIQSTPLLDARTLAEDALLSSHAAGWVHRCPKSHQTGSTSCKREPSAAPARQGASNVGQSRPVTANGLVITAGQKLHLDSTCEIMLCKHQFSKAGHDMSKGSAPFGMTKQRTLQLSLATV